MYQGNVHAQSIDPEMGSVYLSNKTANSFTISWVSASQCVGEVHYGLAPDMLNNVAYDVCGKNIATNVHYIDLINLEEETAYYYAVLEDGVVIESGMETTYKDIGMPIIMGYTVYGQTVRLDDGTTVRSPIVYAVIEDNDSQGNSGESMLLSSLSRIAGYEDYLTLSSELSKARVSDGSSYFSFSTDEGDIIHLASHGYKNGELKGAKSVDTVFINKILDIGPLEMDCGWPPLPELIVTPDNRLLSYAGGSTTFSVSNTGSGTMDWTASVTSGGSWLSIASGASGTNSGTITVSFRDNGYSCSSRGGKIKVSAPGAASPNQIEVTVRQEAHRGLIKISPSHQIVTSSSGTYTFTVSGPIIWTASVTSGGNWLSIASGASGISGTITVSFTGNTGATSRVGKIEVSAPSAAGSLKQTMLTVTQPGIGPAQEIHVYPGGSIQDAIDAAINRDVIIVHEGIYYENIYFQGKAITIKSTDPDDPKIVAATIIDGSKGRRHVVRFQDGEGSDSMLNGVTVQNGQGGNLFGAGISCGKSSPSIMNCTISGNIAGLGGGIYCRESSPIITNCIISENTAPHGGGIFCSESWWKIE